MSFRLLLTATVVAAGFAVDTKEPSESEIQDIINRFAAKEAEFARARDNYTYRQTVRIHELDDSGAVRGRAEWSEDIIFSPDGKRTEKVLWSPVPTLKGIVLTPEDLQDIRTVQPFVLTTPDLPKYHIRFLGKQMADEIPCYVFAVKPKTLEPGQRYFQGQIWVDDRDLQIVKSYGRATGHLKKGSNQQFPKFETFRDQVDGKYWFPVYTAANDVLDFGEGSRHPIRMTVKYEDYKQFKSDVKIEYGEPVQGKKPEKP
jgi:hypothetical protein